MSSSHKVLVLGNDGYIGYPLTIHLLKRGYTVFGIDDKSRRRRVSEVGSDSLTPIASAWERKLYLKTFKNFADQVDLSLGFDSPGFIRGILSVFKPDTIIHLAEQPSAPWSMKSVQHATETQKENVIGTLHLLWAIKEACPEAHLIKLGTMGEYGTPPCIIPEGYIPYTCLEELKPGKIIRIEDSRTCPMADLLFPRTAGSWYHLSKVHDTHNIEFACRNWGLRSTDIMQGVVFGLMPTSEDVEITRFDYDEYFGTVINRFCVQALIGHPITPYGKGGQTRGFLTLKDSITCLTIALENPPKQGEYRTLNQFAMTCSVDELAIIVKECASELGLSAEVLHIENPRKEMEEHYYLPVHHKLKDLGYKPTTNLKCEITSLLKDLIHYTDNVKEEVIDPTTKW